MAPASPLRLFYEPPLGSVFVKILVTGAAGFIGAAVCGQLLQFGHDVVGIDNLDDYYDVDLKHARLKRLTSPNFRFLTLDIVDQPSLSELFRDECFHRVVHLAAQAGVRYSLQNPRAYVDSNLVGFLNVLEGCRQTAVGHLVYASSSSVYGANTRLPFRVQDNVDHPVSLYAATKKANELMAHSYSHLYEIPTTGLRFFTVYGPWGRPDMAMFVFTRKILANEAIDVFNYGKHRRDFTYIDDIVEGVVRVLDNVAAPDADWSADSPDPASSEAPYRLYNIGNNEPIALERYIAVIEACVGRKAVKNFLPLQPGDVADTFADVSTLVADLDYRPSTPIEIGVKKFVDWYREFYGV